MSKVIFPQLICTRRGFLLSTIYGLVAIPSAKSKFQFFEPIFRKHQEESLYLSSANKNKKSYIVGLDYNGKIHFEIPVGARCHGVATHPIKNHIVTVYPKRPGYIAYVVDFKSGQVKHQFSTASNRYFYGHGTYSLDGKYLFTSENDFAKKRGLISIRETNTYKVIEEMNSGGIGPHELIALSDGKNLAIANGGLFEHPNVGDGREKLNIDTMDPSLVILEVGTKKVIESLKPKDHFMGLRHLSVTQDLKILSAIQYEGENISKSPLVSLYQGGELEYLHLPEYLANRTKGYALSIQSVNDLVAVSFSKGDFVAFWRISSKEFLGYFEVKDPGGISLSPDNKSFLLSSSYGSISRIDISSISKGVGNKIGADSTIINDENIRWDNHIIKVA